MLKQLHHAWLFPHVKYKDIFSYSHFALMYVHFVKIRKKEILSLYKNTLQKFLKCKTQIRCYKSMKGHKKNITTYYGMEHDRTNTMGPYSRPT
jgi:hypothetical protein